MFDLKRVLLYVDWKHLSNRTLKLYRDGMTPWGEQQTVAITCNHDTKLYKMSWYDGRYRIIEKNNIDDFVATAMNDSVWAEIVKNNLINDDTGIDYFISEINQIAIDMLERRQAKSVETRKKNEKARNALILAFLEQSEIIDEKCTASYFIRKLDKNDGIVPTPNKLGMWASSFCKEYDIETDLMRGEDSAFPEKVYPATVLAATLHAIRQYN